MIPRWTFFWICSFFCTFERNMTEDSSLIGLFYAGGIWIMFVLTLLVICLFITAWKKPQWVMYIGILSLSLALPLGHSPHLCYGNFPAVFTLENASQAIIALRRGRFLKQAVPRRSQVSLNGDWLQIHSTCWSDRNDVSGQTPGKTVPVPILR